MASERDREDPTVVLSCLSGMLKLAPDWALPRLRDQLQERASGARELAAEVLGESGREDALELLLECIANAPVASERAELVNAVGLNRSDRAVHALIEMVSTGRPTDAVMALRALAPRKFDDRLRQRVREAVERQSEASVARAFDDLFQIA
jgi:HEAT repeat protein